jgi:hypothetical protein
MGTTATARKPGKQKSTTGRTRATTRTRTFTRRVKAIVWNSKRTLLNKGGTMVFISGKGKQGDKYDCYGPIRGNGLEFETNLAKALGIDQGELHNYLDGRVVYGMSVHGLLFSTDKDRKASAQARA